MGVLCVKGRFPFVPSCSYPLPFPQMSLRKRTFPEYKWMNENSIEISGCSYDFRSACPSDFVFVLERDNNGASSVPFILDCLLGKNENYAGRLSKQMSVRGTCLFRLIVRKVSALLDFLLHLGCRWHIEVTERTLRTSRRTSKEPW